MLGRQGGCFFAGWALLMLDNKRAFVYEFSNQARSQYRIASDQALSHGKHAITFDFNYDDASARAISVDGKKVARGRIGSFDETFDISEDAGTPVLEDYAAKMPLTTSIYESTGYF